MFTIFKTPCASHKILYGIIFTFLLSAILGLSACDNTDEDQTMIETSSENVAEEFNEFSDSVKEFTFEKKEDASEFLDQEIKNLGNRIDDAEQNLQEHGSEISEGFTQEKQQVIESIKGYREDLQNLAATVKESSQEEWQEIKNDVSLAYNNTKRGIKDAWNTLSDNSNS